MTGLALVTHSTSPRGGMVHTLALGEALHRQGVTVRLLTQGDPGAGLFRATDLPYTVLPAPPHTGTLTERVCASIDALSAALSELAGPADILQADILHAQDCIAARAAARVRDAGAPVSVVRTVHHVDDFTTPALVTCQRAAIHEPDRVLVVSRQWRDILRADHGVDPDVVPNGVDPDRFGPVPDAERARLRARVGAAERFLLLSVGGVEPRKGTRYAFEALAKLKWTAPAGRSPVLAVVGGHSFRDYAAYRDEALGALPSLGLVLGEDVVLLGTVSEAELGGWYRAADALAFPSVSEGWGLAVLEAMTAGLPVIATDLPVFREYLRDRETALLPTAGDATALATAMAEMASNAALRARLVAGGRALVPSFTWSASARRHRSIYEEVRAARAAHSPAVTSASSPR